MSTSSFVAYSELTRVLPWSIRARGYAFGTADRASFLVANAASMAPEVLGDIAALGERPSGGLQRQWGEGVLSVEASGVSWLEAGPAVMDYCGAHAKEHGAVACRVTGASEASLLPAVLLTGADYGLSAVAVRGEGRAMRWTLLGWSAEQEARPVLLCGEGREDLDRWLAEAVKPGELPEAFDGTHILAWRAPRLTIPAGETGATDAQACIDMAFSKGIPVTREVLEGLYELEKITWAPTSERSRAQAGFQSRPGGQ